MCSQFTNHFVGAPLSQNGNDNSGHLSTPEWTTSNSVQATVQVMQKIVTRYASGKYSNVLSGIEVINEPLMSALSGGRGATQAYYQSAFNIIKAAGNTPVVIHDGFALPSSWNGFLSGTGTIVDHHQYEVFTNAYVALTPEEHIGQVYSDASEYLSGCDKTLIVGEWTAAMTDCAPALNGYGIGARFDGTYSRRNPDGTYDSSTAVGSCANINFIDQWSAYNKSTTTNFIKAQISAYETQANGWSFWNFKTEASAEWDLFRLLDAGVFPTLS